MSDTFDNGLYIDGVYYHVPILSCKRNADFLWKYADRTEDGEHAGELLGIYFNYTLSFGQIVDMYEYNRLYQKLTEKREYHTVVMPGASGSMFTYHAYFSKVSDEVKKSKAGKNIFMKLKVEFVSKFPTIS